jgi:hypothetical protein
LSDDEADCSTLSFGVRQAIVSCIVGARLKVSNSFPPIEAKGCPVISPTKLEQALKVSKVNEADETSMSLENEP